MSWRVATLALIPLLAGAPGLDPKSLEPRRKALKQVAAHAPTCIGRGLVVLGSRSGLRALAADRGQLLWQRNLGQQLVWRPAQEPDRERIIITACAASVCRNRPRVHHAFLPKAWWSRYPARWRQTGSYGLRNRKPDAKHRRHAPLQRRGGREHRISAPKPDPSIG